MRLHRLHHVTAICSDAQRTVAFYRDELGFRLVKKTVNFDDPGSYHLYFGDDTGLPGTLITFFEWPGAQPGRPGRGTTTAIRLHAPGATPGQVDDPDGLRLELIEAERPGLVDVSVYGKQEFYAELLGDDAPLRFVEPPPQATFWGPGVTHHIAWRVADEEEQAAWRERLLSLGLRPTEVLDRKYFRSVYFRLPDGVLFELATVGPGFSVDEPADDLGETLALPGWLEGDREAIEQHLVPIT